MRTNRGGIILSACFVFATIGWSAVIANPFGIQRGLPVNSLKVVRQLNPTLFEVTAPNPNSSFTRYMVVATPKHGVCQVVGATENFKDYEAATLPFLKLRRVLTQRYGRHDPIVNDMLHVRPAFIFEDADSEWRVMKNKTLPHNLRSIMLERLAADKGTSTRVRLTYTFNNLSDCLNWEPYQDRSGL